MERKTKIICTIGPASSSEEMLRKLITNGMNVARLNFSHGTHESHKEVMDRIKKLREEMRVPVAILLDTKGPEFRIGTFEKGKVSLNQGDEFCFYTEDKPGNEKGVSVSYKHLAKELAAGDTVLVNNGLCSFEVERIEGDNVICRALDSFVISDRKSMNFPGKVLKQDFLSEQDKSDLLFGIENDVDFIAASFVSNGEDMRAMRDFLDRNGGQDIQVIAKIENSSGVEHIKEILDIAEGIMVARGDLGVEIPYVELPSVQKHIIKTCLKKGGISVTATEMLESMTEKPRPTRAEISDVANAVFDGTSAIMLSGETASGKFPDLAVKAMSDIAIDAEKHIDYEHRFRNTEYEMDDLTDSLSHSAAQLALDTRAKCLVVPTSSGFTVRMVERCRIPVSIIGVSKNLKTIRQMSLYWNVRPVIVRQYDGIEELVEDSAKVVKENGFAKTGDIVVVTGGLKNKIGGTRFIHADIIE